MTHTLSITLTGVTPAQVQAITKIMQEETPATRTRKSKPETTVSEEEDEDFGKKPLRAKDLDEDTDEDESDESESNDGDEDEDEEPAVTFAEVRAALNKYGEKHPDQARAILSGFNIKGPKELSAKHNQKYWAPVYAKVMAKIKAAKKGK